MKMLTSNQLEAYDAGTAAGKADRQPLTVYIEEGNFHVCDGRETIMTTDSCVALMSFFNGWQIAYVKLDSGE